MDWTTCLTVVLGVSSSLITLTGAGPLPSSNAATENGLFSKSKPGNFSVGQPQDNRDNAQVQDAELYLKRHRRDDEISGALEAMFYHINRPHPKNRPEISEERRLRDIEDCWEEGMDLNVQNKNHDGNTILHLAVLKNYPQILVSLLHRGASVYSKNEADQTPLELAKSISPQNETIIALLEDFAKLHPETEDDVNKDVHCFAEDRDEDHKQEGHSADRESVESDVIGNIFNLLTEGSKTLKLGEKPEIVLLLGNTGSGKTTLTQHIATDNSQLFVEELKGGNYVISDRDRKISRKTIDSKTLYPELFMSEDGQTAYYDCPGFMDTRSYRYDIAANYFIKKVIDSAERVKMVFVVMHDSVTLRQGDRQDFMKMVKHAVTFVKDIEKFKNAISLVITKVHNQDDGNHKLSDKKIIAGVADFLTDTKATLEERETKSDIDKKTISFINIVLEKDDDDKYKRIGIFRRPTGCGNLNELPLFQQGKKVIDNMIDTGTTYVDKLESDFGYSISEESKNNVVSLGDRINSKITDLAKEIGEYLGNRVDFDVSSSDSVDMTKNKLEKIVSLIANSLTKINSITDPILFANELDSSVKEMKFSKPISLNKHTNEIRTQGSYLEFLDKLNGQVLGRQNDKWKTPLNDFKTKLDSLMNWYQFLFDMRRKLTEYNIQNAQSSKNKINPDVKPFEKDLKFGEYGVEFLNIVSSFSKIKDRVISEMNYKEVNKILQFTLRESHVKDCKQGNILVVKGNFVKLSEVYNNLATDKTCKDQTLRGIEIYALDTVYIDGNLDLLGKGFSLAIFSPKWEITGKTLINLDGTDGKDVDSKKAANGVSKGSPGVNGAPGFPGGHAGSFFGIGKKFINSDMLTISAKGGKGGAAEDGGDGVDGEVGENVAESDIPSISDWSAKKMGRFRYTTRDVRNPNLVHQFWFLGKDGSPGGDGGKGGAGGYSGNRGTIEIFDLSEGTDKLEAHIEIQDGEAGRGGKGGKNGLGGKTGDDYSAEIHYTLGTFPHWTNFKKIPCILTGPNGSPGQDNSNNKFQEKLDAIVPVDFTEDLNKYKVQLLKSQDKYLEKSDLLGYISSINENSKIRGKYEDIVFLYDEFLQFETAFFKNENQGDLIPYYDSFMKRITKYTESLVAIKGKTKEENNSVKKALGYLYTGVLSKFSAMHHPRDSDLITDMVGHMEHVESMIKSLDKKERLVIINELRDDYKKDSDKKIEEAHHFIDDEVLAGIDSIMAEMDDRIVQLVAESVAMQKDAKSDKDLLVKKRKTLQNTLVLRSAFGVLKGVGALASCLGPGGAAAGGLLGALSGTAETFIVDGKATENIKPMTNLPPIIKSSLAKVDTTLKGDKDLRLRKLSKQVTQIGEAIGDFPDTYKDLDKDLREIAKDIETEQARGATMDPESVDKMHNLQNKLKEKLEAKQKRLKGEDKDRVEKKNRMHSKMVGRFQNAVLFGDAIVDSYSKIKADDAALTELDKQIVAAGDKIEKWRDYERKIYKTMVPMVNSVQNDMNQVVNNLGDKSSVALDVQRWKVQSTLNELRLEMKGMTKEMESQERLLDSIEKLDEGMSTLVDVYDKIQNYQEQKRLADYVANINSAESMRVTTDPKIVDKLAKVDMVIQSNILLEEYDRTMNAFKQWVFPFANLYMDDFYMPPIFDISNANSSYELLVSGVLQRLEKIKLRLEAYHTKIQTGQDEYLFTSKFISDSVFMHPFFIWDNANHRRAIENLLDGKPIILKADVTKTDPKKSAVKFNSIEINFRAHNASLQSEIDKILQGFSVRMHHQGNSYYRMGQSFYKTTNGNLSLEYSFEKKDKCCTDQTIARGKLSHGDSVLSPYAFWDIQMSSLTDIANFEKLKIFADKVDLHLTGEGVYVKGMADFTSLNLNSYYQLDETLKDNFK